MSKSNKLHQCALATAMVAALTAGSAAAAGRVDAAGLHSPDQTSFDRVLLRSRAA